MFEILTSKISVCSFETVFICFLLLLLLLLLLLQGNICGGL